MIVDLPSTTTKEISKKLVRLRQDVGAMALSRVLTLVLVVDERHAEEAIQVANDASHQHPCRIIAVVTGNKRGASRLDAQIRVGGDAGASEVVVLRLYGPLTRHGRSVVIPLLLPDSPVVAWWPTAAPRRISEDSIGAMAQRRITDAAEAKNPRAEMKHRAETYAPGDTDLAWTRITLWRGLLAAALDQPPYEPVLSATVTGGSDSPSADLLAAWLAQYLKCPVRRTRSRAGTGIVSVRLERRAGNIDLVRPEGDTATLIQPGQPDRTISLPHRSDAECLADELRRLDPDEVYQEVMTRGMPRLAAPSKGKTASEAVADGEAPSVVEAERTLRRLRRGARIESRSAMVEAAPEPEASADTATVKKAAARKLARVKAGSDPDGAHGDESGAGADPGSGTDSTAGAAS
ncbi:glucose-6-phosphate dehydrogenase assembly protein OpcA [Knoellia sp. 3-2P3]|uniref:glucose-6-phosphate dehydrogenase assembly protein OpcA n=1 Tax=unclassified Knoellia TaxID=2618719 RepID=UPI0023DCB71A|nr:glucose-6-phosphate dehydrogenase assembly protein OpcA [Knoellia sp. 3-2P3]MDF2091904.1 glucose-6-phosphate dehydrogenase assembly protein OpcA [Knoellia sp. 3-2P3]